MTEILDEAFDEAIGRSSKRWALLLLAFVLGGALAFWLVQRSRGAGPEALDSFSSTEADAEATGGA